MFGIVDAGCGMRDAETFGLCKGGKYEAWKYGKTDPIFKVKGKYDKKDAM